MNTLNAIFVILSVRIYVWGRAPCKGQGGIKAGRGELEALGGGSHLATEHGLALPV